MSVATVENRDSRQDTASPAIDWRKRASDAWSDPGWGEAAADYHRSRGKRPLIVETEPYRLTHLRRLLMDSVSLERAWGELNRRQDAPQATVAALVYELRMHGLAAFEHSNCRRRLAELSAEQLRELIAALIRVRERFAVVTDELLIALDRIRRP
jgi:hypothetical protein